MPDQAEFLERWYEFHRGYRVVRKEDGSEERIAVLGEEWMEVSPGELPRTLEELREGRREEAAAPAQMQEHAGAEQTGPSLDDTLESMFQAASLEETGEGAQGRQAQRAPQERTLPELLADSESRRRRSNVHAQAMVPAGSRNREYQQRRVNALRRELHRMRNGIERVMDGLRELGEPVPEDTQATQSLAALGQTLDDINQAPGGQEADRNINDANPTGTEAAPSDPISTSGSMQARVDAARHQMDQARRARDQAASELDQAEGEFQSSQSRFQQLQREQRTAENYMRIFGTREEMLAQGENYESPIGGMFRRADERFRAAEDVRREERTLRQVLADEARAGGEEEARRLAQYQPPETDVWGVPMRDRRLETLNQTRRDGIPRFYRYPSTYPQQNEELGSEEVQPPQGEGTALDEYYRMMRQQEGAQLSPDQTSAQVENEENFPRTMLNAILEARQQELSNAEDSTLHPIGPDGGLVTAAERDQWWHSDVDFVLGGLLSNTQLRQSLQQDEQQLRAYRSYHQANVISEETRTTFDSLLRSPTVIWQTGLPAEWVQRRRASVPNPSYQDLLFAAPPVPDSARDLSSFVEHHNPYIRTEIIAQAFQMSAEVRRQALGLSPPERLGMLYRLQAGHREEQDVAVLEQLQQNQDSKTLAFQTYNDNTRTQPSEWTDNARRYDDLRRRRARRGDHSRQELNASRQATSAFALAAGRQAMQAGPHTLLERMAERDAETRAAYHRLQANGFTDDPPAAAARTRPTLYRQLTLDDYGASQSTSESDPEDDEEDQEQGLDARDTGRPEPKTDEEMLISMECKICYTQTAEVACLPCGHLVMCRWCSDQHSPVLQHDRTRPRRAAGCPVCRKGVRQKVRVYRV